LQEHQVISRAVVAALRNAVGLRNLVAHGYAGVDRETALDLPRTILGARWLSLHRSIKKRASIPPTRAT